MGLRYSLWVLFTAGLFSAGCLSYLIISSGLEVYRSSKRLKAMAGEIGRLGIEVGRKNEAISANVEVLSEKLQALSQSFAELGGYVAGVQSFLQGFVGGEKG